jgi:hypothetical protein
VASTPVDLPQFLRALERDGDLKRALFVFGLADLLVRGLGA